MLRVSRMAGGRGVVLLLVVLPATLPIDAAIHDLTFRYVVTHEVRLLSNGFTHLGTAWASSGLLGGLAVVGYRTADAGLLRASLGGLGGIALGSLASHVAKQLACRGRPGLLDGWGVGAPEPIGAGPAWVAAWSFFHWPCLTDSRYHSFPSGHAATAFAVAAALVAAVPSRRGVWLATATGIGASRVLLNAHFLSDVLGGAVIGWWATRVGWTLAERVAPRLLPEAGELPASVDARPHAGIPSV